MGRAFEQQLNRLDEIVVVPADLREDDGVDPLPEALLVPLHRLDDLGHAAAGFSPGAQEQATPGASLAEPGFQRGEQGVDAVGLHQPMEAAVALVQDGGDQAVLVADVLVERAARDARSARQPVHAGGGEAVSFEELLGGLEQACTYVHAGSVKRSLYMCKEDPKQNAPAPLTSK